MRVYFKKTEYVAHLFKPNRDRWISEFEASLVYRASSRTGSKATEKHYLEKQKQNKTGETGTQMFNSIPGLLAIKF